MKTDYSPKSDLRRGINCLEGADNAFHEIVFHLDLEWGPDSSSRLAVDIASIQRHLDSTLQEARELLRKNRGKLAVGRTQRRKGGKA